MQRAGQGGYSPRFLFHLVVLSLLLIAAPPLARAKTYYANNAGCSDTGEGTKQQPFCSLSKATARLQPGDTLELLHALFSEQMTVVVSGTRGKPITIQAATGAKPVIDGSKLSFTSGGLVNADKQSYITIRGIALKASPYHCMQFTAGKSIILEQVTIDGCKRGGVVFDQKSAEVTVSKCDIKDTGKCGKDCGVQGAITLSDTTGFEVANNQIHDTVKEGVVATNGSSAGTIHHNQLEKTGAAGIVLNHAFALCVYRNTVKASTTSGVKLALGYQATGKPETTNNHLFQNEISGSKTYGLIFAGTQPGDMGNNYIYNNVFYANTNLGIVLNNTDNNTVANNILALNTKGGIGGDRVGDNEIYNNLFHNSGKGVGEQPVEGDPLFDDAANGVFTLQEDSPAIDAGYQMGLNYQHLPDIGAHEHIFSAGCSLHSSSTAPDLMLLLVLAALLAIRRRAI